MEATPLNAADYIKENIINNMGYEICPIEICPIKGSPAMARIFSSGDIFPAVLFRDLLSIGVLTGVATNIDGRPYVLCKVKEPDTTTTGAST